MLIISQIGFATSSSIPELHLQWMLYPHLIKNLHAVLLPPRHPLDSHRMIYFDMQLNEMLEEKVRPYIQDIDNGVLSHPIILQSKAQDQKVLSPPLFLSTCFRVCTLTWTAFKYLLQRKPRQRRWWFFWRRTLFQLFSNSGYLILDGLFGWTDGLLQKQFSFFNFCMVFLQLRSFFPSLFFFFWLIAYRVTS